MYIKKFMYNDRYLSPEKIPTAKLGNLIISLSTIDYIYDTDFYPLVGHIQNQLN